MVRDELPSTPQIEAVEEVLEDRGYEARETNLTRVKNSDETFEYTSFRKSPVNSSLVYDQETGDVVQLSVALPKGRPYDSETGLHDLDPDAVQSAIDYLQNEDRIEYDDELGSITARFEPQETPEETADLLEETAEAVETVADIREALS